MRYRVLFKLKVIIRDQYDNDKHIKTFLKYKVLNYMPCIGMAIEENENDIFYVHTITQLIKEERLILGNLKVFYHDDDKKLKKYIEKYIKDENWFEGE